MSDTEKTSGTVTLLKKDVATEGQSGTITLNTGGSGLTERLQTLVSPEMQRELAMWALRRRTSQADVVREALSKQFHEYDKERVGVPFRGHHERELVASYILFYRGLKNEPLKEADRMLIRLCLDGEDDMTGFRERLGMPMLKYFFKWHLTAMCWVEAQAQFFLQTHHLEDVSYDDDRQIID